MTGAKIVAQAKKYLGKGGSSFCKEYGFNYIVAWCCIFVWYVFRKAKAAKLFYSGGKVCNCRVAWNWCKANLRHISMKDAKPGDIVFFTWTGQGFNKENGNLSIDHIGLIRAKGTASVAKTIEGNTGGGSPATNKVMNRERAARYILGIYRPKYEQKITKKSKGLTKVAAYAKKRALEHHKYKLGGWSWKNGIECHAFTAKCFKDCGYSKVYKRIKRKGFWKKAWKNAYLGKYLVKHRATGLKTSDLLPGDILYTSYPGSHHSAIYIGNGKVAEAVGSGTRVKKLRKSFKYAFRISESMKDAAKKKTKTKVKTVAHKATYKVLYKNGVTVRKTHNTNSAKVGSIKCGKSFKVTKKHGNWVYNPDLKGWICIKGKKGTYIKKK